MDELLSAAVAWREAELKEENARISCIKSRKTVEQYDRQIRLIQSELNEANNAHKSNIRTHEKCVRAVKWAAIKWAKANTCNEDNK